jgi:hypothetical protein
MSNFFLRAKILLITMAINTIQLNREWKQTLTKDKYVPYAMQVSLFDLLFYYDKNKELQVRFLEDASSSSFRSMGYELPHSTIVFDSNLYKEYENSPVREIDKNQSSFDDYIKSGFDIALPQIDFRSKPLFLSSKNIADVISGQTEANINSVITNLNVADLDHQDYYYKLGVKGIKVWDFDAIIKPIDSYDFYSNSVLAKHILYAENTWEDYPNPWTVALEDDYNKGYPANSSIILCNRDITFEERFLKDELHLMAYNGICLNYKNLTIWRNFFQYFNSKDKTAPASLNDITPTFFSLNHTKVVSINPIFLYLIQHCYLFIKCSFFADYIDYRDFNQSLNQKSKTIFNNIMLTNIGDYKRYEEYFTKDISGLQPADRELNTQPYFPTTTPSIDLIRDRYINTASGMLSGLQQLIDYGNDPDGKIGIYPITPFEKIQTITEPSGPLPPPIWFDPESRKEASDYTAYPIVYQKDGNAIIDGRIISPTIDELWQMIKELVGGRKADNNALTEDAAGYPIGTGEYFTTFDSRATIPEHQFLDYSTNEYGKLKRGDPISIQYELNSDDPHYEVLKWINNPTSIQYKIIEELKAVNDVICNYGDPIFIKHSINSLPSPSDYAPSLTIPSLRELEALLKGLRQNFVRYIQFMRFNGVYIGPLGRNNQDAGGQISGWNNAAGSAYQLHQDYNTQITNAMAKPNTVYDARKTLSPNDFTIIGTGLGSINSFGNNQDEVPSWSVYLAADGKWHSTWQATVLRIRNDEVY